MFIGIYVQHISGERLQDHWSSGFFFHLFRTRAFSLYKTGSGFRYQMFSQLAEKKFPIEVEHSQLAGKSQFKRETFPILLKFALFLPKIVVLFPKITQFFPNFIGTKNFPKRSEKALRTVLVFIHLHVLIIPK